MDLQDKIIVVTGGKGLLGSVFVQHIRDAGGIAICADITAKDDLEKGEYGLDIRSEKSVDKLCDAVMKKYKRIDGWVNNAYPKSDDWYKSFEDMPFDSWRENVDSHLNGYALCCKVVLPRMKKQKSGSFLNIASIFGVIGPDFHMYEGMSFTSPAPYAAIKGGIIQMTRYFASLYGQDGIRVNALSPGGIFHGQPKEFVERYAKKTPLGRMGTPEDIAPAVVLLLSDAASYITGINLLVDGGWTII